MAKIISIIKLCLDLGAIALDLLKAAVQMYKDYMQSLDAATQEQYLA